ncbi:pilus assembly protein TadG-related protein [Egicoccus halophilus]|uniref:Putative Flp pilus-assembly TadG-like N-terminal domain-containing protein n=1 Tax=Egicoccus halophilus TaxID=1670830 RepID=A0A8J3ETY4_9ACTN|nr:pilus assembly protein TadG-related protein [Egicoccus halophilus]GGI04833.1 hypothetical protein GCM10011354_11070 [Egicoccus halophilus]
MQRLKEEDGAIAVVTAVVLVVLVGMLALVLDVGNLYWERRQLQNGADAAALAAARDLASGSGGTAYATARQYANDNNPRGAFVGPSDFVTTSSSVQVTARTGSLAAAGQLPSIFAGVLGVNGYATSATARVTWGNIGSGTTIPLAICGHAWNTMTSNGTVLPSGPPDQILRIGVPPGHVTPGIDCSNPGAGDPPPGGFGFLSADGNCQATMDVGNWMPGANGNTPDIGGSSPCGVNQLYAMLHNIVTTNQTVLVPIFGEYKNQGSTGSYQIVGFGAFRLLGYSVNGGPSPSNPAHGRVVSWSGSCPGSATCLRGYFTNFVSLDGVVAGPSVPSYGATVISLTN